MGTATWHPKWWTTDHTSSWDRIKEAMKRDWEQTKDDLGAKGRDLDQSVGDTVKQATGKEAIPPLSQPNTNAPAPPLTSSASHGHARGLSWDNAERPLSYGFGAAQRYGTGRKWDDTLESELRTDWESEHHSTAGEKWDEVKGLVRRGYDHAFHPHH